MECPTYHDANRDRDYEGPSCDTCKGVGFVGIPSDQEFVEIVQRLADRPHEVEQWIRDRAANATRLGRLKTDPADQAGWFEDAAYLTAARALLRHAMGVQH